MRRKARGMALLMLCLIAVGIKLLFLSAGEPGPQPSPELPTIEMVKELSELTTLRVVLADVVFSDIAGLAGGAEAGLLLRGDFTVSTDLSVARFEQVDVAGHRAVLVLPQPKASPPRIDHSRSRVVLIRQTGIWRIVPGDDACVAVVNEVYREAQRIVAAGDQQEYQDAARRRAEHVLQTFYNRIGWGISVRWISDLD